MEKTRREFLKQSLLGGAGITLTAMGMPASSYARILGANDRVNVGLVGFSDRARQALLHCFFANNKELNFDLIGVSDIWKHLRDEGKALLENKTGHRIQTYVNNDELYKNK